LTTSIYRWVLRFTPLLAEAARPCRHAVGDRWEVDETYVKVAGRWRYVYRAIDQFGQVIDISVSVRRNARAARRCLEQAIGHDKGHAGRSRYRSRAGVPGGARGVVPAAWHRTDRYANNRLECDHGRLKSRLRSMRGLKQDHSAKVVIAGHAFVQNLRRGHYELAVEVPVNRRLAVVFAELPLVT
jgi:IS6 family transposase